MAQLDPRVPTGAPPPPDGGPGGSPRRETGFNWRISVGMFVGLAILFVMGPNQFGSLLRRAFAPFRDGVLANRAEITLLKPAGGRSSDSATAIRTAYDTLTAGLGGIGLISPEYPTRGVGPPCR